MVPAPGGDSEFANRMRIVDPAGNVLAELTFAARTTVGVEQTGAWTTSEDPSGTVTTEGYFTMEDGADQSIEFTFELPDDRPITEVAPAVAFARHLHGPNRLRIAGPVGPFHDLLLLDAREPPVAPIFDRIVQALVAIQMRISTPLTLRHISPFTEDDVRRILRAAHLIDGSTLVGHWDKLKIDGVPVGTLEVGCHYQLTTYEPLIVQLGGVEYQVGAVEHILLSALIETDDVGNPRPVPNLNDTVHSRFLEKIPEPADGAPAGAIPVRGRLL